MRLFLIQRAFIFPRTSIREDFTIEATSIKRAVTISKKCLRKTEIDYIENAKIFGKI